MYRKTEGDNRSVWTLTSCVRGSFPKPSEEQRNDTDYTGAVKIYIGQYVIKMKFELHIGKI